MHFTLNGKENTNHHSTHRLRHTSRGELKAGVFLPYRLYIEGRAAEVFPPEWEIPRMGQRRERRDVHICLGEDKERGLGFVFMGVDVGGRGGFGSGRW